MKLEDYLQGLKKCPDEWINDSNHGRIHRLTYDFGIYGNYRIFLDLPKCNAEEVFRTVDFEPIDISRFQTFFKDLNGIKFALKEQKSGEPFFTNDKVCSYPFKTFFWIEQSISSTDSKDYLNGRDLTIKLMHALRDNQVKFCINSTSLGWKYISKNGVVLPEGYSQIVYHPDSFDTEIQKLRVN